MEKETTPRKKSKIRKWILISVLSLISLLLILFAIASLYAYYRGSEIVKAWVTQKVNTQSKGLYTLTIRDVDLVFFPGRLRIEGLSLVPDTARYRELLKTDTMSSVLLTVNVEKILLKEFDVLRVMRDKEVCLDRLVIEAPDIRIDEYDVPVERQQQKQKRTIKLNFSLPSGLNLIQVNEVRLNNGKLLVRDHRKDTLKETAFPYISFEIDSILIDSSQTPKHLFNAEDIRLTLRGLSKTTKNGMNTISLGEIGISTGKGAIYVKDFHLKPEVSQVEYGQKLGFQTDWMDVKAKEIRLEGIDIPLLILSEHFRAEKLVMDSVDLQDYRDKRNPPRKNWKPLMPHEALTNLKVRIQIDSVLVTNAKLTYSEQSGEKPGAVFFEDVKLSAGPVTNDSTMLAAGFVMKVNATAKLMGSGAVSLSVDFPMPAKNGEFSFSGLLTGFDMTKINPFVSAQVPAKIISGYVEKAVIPPVYANSHHSKGTIVLYYKDLKMDLPPQNDKKWEHMKKSVLAWAANTYVAESNPSHNGKLRQGVIYFERDPSKSIFNYLWKSLFSGIKSTVNVNTKEQKEIKKTKKQQSKKK